MCDNLDILNLHYFKRDSFISVICQATERAVEDKKTDAVAHLALARSQNTRNGISGNLKEGGCYSAAFLLYIKTEVL